MKFTIRWRHRDNKTLRPLSWLTFILLCIWLSGAQAALPRQGAYPGGVMKIKLGSWPQAPQVYYGKKRVLVYQNSKHWYAFVGIPLDAKPGAQQLQVHSLSGKRKKTFWIKNKKYRKQYLTVKKKRHVNPNPKDLERILKEKKEILGYLDHWRETMIIPRLFRLPVKGRFTSEFGRRRFFNKQPRAPHKGIDLAAPLGTPLKSPMDAKVLATGDYFFNGRTVFLDHGQGLITMYCHMHRIDVNPGQQVKTGQSIGKIGKSGRVTGPHVHWGVFLNGEAVDPALFLPKGSLRKN